MEEDEDVDGGMGEGRTTMTRKMVAAEGDGKTPTGPAREKWRREDDDITWEGHSSVLTIVI